MQKNRLWAIGGSVFVVLIIALLVIPSFIDWSKYQSVAQTKLKAATGYDMKINGSLSISLLPSPHAKVTDVILTKPVPGQNDPFLTLEKADVRLAFFPLLVGKVKVSSITLEKPVVTLITYNQAQDNFTPVKTATTQPVDPVTGQPAVQEPEAEGAAVSINELKIKDGNVTIRNDEAATSQLIGIEELSVKADSLSGPFDGNGKVSLNNAHFKVDMNTGGYKDGETLPVQIDAEDEDGRAKLKWSGVVKMTGEKEYQGELSLKFSDLEGLLEDAGYQIAVPDLGDAELTGMLTVNPNNIQLGNGTLKLGKTKLKAKVDLRDLKTDAKTIIAALETDDVLDIDEMVKVANQVAEDQRKLDEKAAKKSDKKDEKPAAPAKAAANIKVKPLLAEDFELPLGMNADISLRAAGINYHDKETGQVALKINAADGLGTGNLAIEELPGGGQITVTAEQKAKGLIEGNVLGEITSVKETLADWLDVVDEETLEQPGMPKRIDMQGTFKVSGYTATMNFSPLSLGETKLEGTVSYTAATKPVLAVNMTGNVFTLPSAKKAVAKEEAKPGETKTADASAEPTKMDFEFDPPQLPFDLKFNIGMGRVVKDTLTLTDVQAAGIYNGAGITLSKGQASVNGGTLSATGTVADLKKLSGIDVNAGLRTTDLESFVEAMTGKPMSLKQKIGDFNGTVKAKGDRDTMAVDATGAARGYTITATGTLDDPFSPEVPGTMDIRIRHADLTQAIRVFSPAFNNSGPQGAPRPVDLSGTAKINGKVYAFNNMKGTLGSSDIAGSLKADLSGDIPSVTADLSSNRMDIGSILGVENKSGKVGAKSASSASAEPVVATNVAGNWSREPLDTGLMKSMILDIKLAAKTLIYGTWTLTDAQAGINLKDGVLKVSPLKGGLYGGSFDATLNAKTDGENKPLAIDGKADVNDVAIGSFLQALTSSSAKRADGTGSVNINVKGEGISAGALMSSLVGDAKVNAKSLVVYGMDIDKLAANIVEAFDGGWKGVLAGITTQGFSGGSSKFKDVDHTFPITNGNMAIKAFKMETTSSNAIVNTNGSVNFAQWYMDVQSDVMVTQPKDVPVINLRISGPLGSPTKSVNSQALDNLIRGKLGDKVNDLLQDKLGDKLKDSPLGGALNQFLGGSASPKPTAAGQTPSVAPSAAPSAPAAAPLVAPVETAPVEVTPAEPQAAAPSAETSAAPAPAAETAPAAPAEEEKSPEEQLLEGVLNKLAE